MKRAIPLATGFLVGVCVFAWLAGPVLEARFGAEALLVAYGAVAVGAAATAYVLVRQADAYLGRAHNSDVSRRSDRDGSKGDSNDTNDANVTVSLDELTDLDVEREVRQLKTQRASGREERSVTGGATTARERQDDNNP